MEEIIVNFFKHILDKIVYINPCFITPIGSNVLKSKDKPYAQCMVCNILSIGGDFKQHFLMKFTSLINWHDVQNLFRTLTT